MLRLTRAGITCVVLLLTLWAVPGQAGELPASEEAKIEALIQHIAHQTEAVFLRNYKGYPAPVAARFLRDKWAATFIKVTTAQEFIEKIASVSSTSGQPYRIRFTDGREIPTGEYLRATLQQMEQ